MFALRSFERNDRIMVERPVVLGSCAKSIAHTCNMANTDIRNPFKPSMKQAVWDLTPSEVVPGIRNDISGIPGATDSEVKERMFEEREK